MGDSGRQDEYLDDERVWVIEDRGEKFWYVADTLGGAVVEHGGMSDDPPEEIAAKLVEPGEMITVIGESRTDFPAAFLEEDDPSEEMEYFSGYRFTATAAEWVEYVTGTLKHRRYQLCATVYP